MMGSRFENRSYSSDSALQERASARDRTVVREPLLQFG